MKFLTCMLISFSLLSAGSTFAEEQTQVSSKVCACKDCPCTENSHCGCRAGKGCSCGAGHSCCTNCNVDER